MNSLNLLEAATKAGWKTSEFWLSVVGILTALELPRIDSWIGHTSDAVAAHGVAGVIAAGAISGAYAVGRSLVKASTAKALLEPVPAPIALIPDSTIVPIGRGSPSAP